MHANPDGADCDRTDDYRRLMSIAVLFESEFSIDWLQELSNLKASHILLLLDCGIQKKELALVRPGFYRVVNAKQAVSRYHGISEKEKEQLHRRMIGVLINEISEDGRNARILSSHLLALSTLCFEDCQWLIKAGDDYAGSALENEAMACYIKATDVLRTISSEAADRLFVEAVNRLGNFTYIGADLNWIVATFQEALRKAVTSKNRPMQALISIQLANKFWLKADYGASARHFKRAWEIAEQVGRLELLRTLSMFSVFYYYWRGRFREAIAVYEKYAQDIDQFSRLSAPLSASIAIAYSYANIGKVNQGVGMFQALCDHCRKIGLPKIAESGELMLCDILISVRRIDDAHRLLSSKKKSSFQQFSISFQKDIFLLQAYVHYRRRELKPSVACLQQALKLADESQAAGNPFSSFGYMLRLSWDMELQRYPRVAALDLDKEIERAIHSPSLVFQGTGYRYLAMLKNRRNAPLPEVQGLLNRSARTLRQSGHKLALARTHIEMARIYLKSGDKRRAKEAAHQAAGAVLAQEGLPFPDDLSFLIGPLDGKRSVMDSMIQLSQEMVMTAHSRDTIRQIILTVIRITGAERGAIFQVDKEAQPWEFVLKAAKNLTVEEIGQPIFQDSMRAIREAAGGGQVVIKEIKDKRASFSTASGMLSCICVPMFLRKEIVGVLYFDNRWFSSVFEKENHPIFTYFAAQAAIAIESADAHEEIGRLKKRRIEENLHAQPGPQPTRLDSFIGQSAAVRHMLEKVTRVAATDATVLITGETGVGKELVASALVRQSRRADKPFIRVNCSAFPETLIASELFGYEKGAFTGAHETRPGRFELADGGTLFLDEIGDIGTEIQVRLLRVLQSGEFERVGGRRTLHSDFRLIAATHQNIDQMVSQERFREDLYYRLNVFPVHVPPLRERKEDIALLTHFFLDKFCKKFGKKQLNIRKADVRRLIDHPWPGNVRELEHVIEQGVIMSSASVFELPEFGKQIDLKEASSPGRFPTLDENLKQHILKALRMCHWKVSGTGGAAELLDINPSTLTSKIRKLGLRRERGQSIFP
ncbi:MAG: GAF domain-containing protein [Desulfobacteraceae bacterium]|nr:MAG: GAF domain-containing protein [Desulfobacteraceae bacterium]